MDTSILEDTKRGLCYILYYKELGLKLLTEKDLEIVLKRINYANQLSNKIIVLPETLKEVQEKIRILDNKIKYIKGGSIYETKNEKRKREQIIEENTEILDNLNLYTNKLYELIRSCSKKDPRINFSQMQHKIYRSILNIARYNSKDFDAEYIREKSKLINPKYTGLELETDKKIIATSFTLAYSEPIIILSQDKGIERLISRVENEIIKRGYLYPIGTLPYNRLNMTDILKIPLNITNSRMLPHNISFN